MSINQKNVSNRLFDILVGTGHAIIMGDEDGKKTLDPNVAVRFYISNKHSMVYFNQAGGLISLSVGNNQRYDDVKDLINSVKQTAKHYLLNFNVKNYGKKLEPKDFAFQVTNEDVQPKVAQIDSPAFKAWFGNSKVVDSTGKPLIVYHGTGGNFRAFSLSHRTSEQGIDQHGTGFYLAESPDLASQYAGTSGSVMPLYARIVNPMDDYTPAFNAKIVEKLLKLSPIYKDSLENFGDVDHYGERTVLQDAVKAFLYADQAINQINTISNDFWRGHDQEFLKALIAITGFDGFEADGYKGRIFVAWSPSQMKSAIGNIGKFDPESEDISEEVSDSPTITESVNMTGTKKLSYQKMESAKIIIRHTKSVNEEVKGARSRSIQAIFIENAQGERFSYPFKYLDGARAICRHVSEGGNPYDEKGQQLIKLAEQYIALRKFVSHANRSNFVNEETGTLVELAQQKALQIGKAMKSGKGLSEMATLIAVEDSDRISAMTGNFTKKTVNKAVESAMPYVLQLLDQHNLQESTSNNLTELIAAISAFPSVELTKMDDSDPNHPKNLKFAGSDIRNKHVAKYLVKHMVNPDLRYKVEELINNYDTLDQVQKDSVVELLRTLIRRAKVINNEHVTNISVKDNVLGGISEEISKYTASKILAKN